MLKCVTIYSNIRTTHKYGNYLQMKIEKYITTVYYFSKKLLNNLFNSKHVKLEAINTNITL